MVLFIPCRVKDLCSLHTPPAGLLPALPWAGLWKNTRDWGGQGPCQARSACCSSCLSWNVSSSVAQE